MLQLQQLDDRVNIKKDWFSFYKFHQIISIEQLTKLVDICINRGSCAYDLETTGVDNRIYPDSYFEDNIKTRHGLRTIDKIVGLSISFDGQNGYYVPLNHEPEDSNNLPWDPVWDEITRLHNSCKIITFNAKFDLEFSYPMTNKEYWKLNEYEDVYFIAKVLNPLKGNPSGLKAMTKQHFGIDMIEIDELFSPERIAMMKKRGQTYNFGVLHPKEGLEYACSDVIFTYKLFPLLREKLTETDLKIYDLEKSFCNVLRKMERNRVHLDIQRVKQLHDECKKEIQFVGDTIRGLIEQKTGKTGKWISLNVGSVKQLNEVLFTDPEGLRLKPTAEILQMEGGQSFESDDDDDDTEESGQTQKQYKLKDDAIKSLHEAYGQNFKTQKNDKSVSMFDLILEYRHYVKMNGSYMSIFLESHDKNGDVRPNYMQIGTDTARLSAQAGKIEHGYAGVAFQGIPRDSDDDKPELFKQIRSCVIPRPGYVLVKIDYSGEELRVVTNLSGDPIWTDSFLNKDGDVHSITARILYARESITKDERNRGKRCNFSFIYGGGTGAVQRNIKCSVEDAQRYMNNFRDGMPVLMGYVEHQKKFAKKHKCIYTAYGRKIPIPAIDSPIQALRRKAERCAINYTVQSTSADILKFALCYVDKNIRALGWDDRVKYVLTVHDEVVFEIRPEYLMEIVQKLDEWMCFPAQLPKIHGREWKVPLITEPGIDLNWQAKWDFIKMTRGELVRNPKFDESGNFIGEVKKGHYYKNGKIYQDIPEFLRPFIKPDHGEIQYPKVDNNPIQTQDININRKSNGSSPEISFDNLTPEQSTEELMEFSLGENPVQIKSGSNEDLIVEKLESPDTVQESEPEPIFRWIIKSTLSENSIRKLHALCILAKGRTLLRIVSPKGTILINESSGIRIDKESFSRYAELFGL